MMIVEERSSMYYSNIKDRKKLRLAVRAFETWLPRSHLLHKVFRGQKVGDPRSDLTSCTTRKENPLNW